MPYSIGELQDVESIQKINRIVEKEFHREITIRSQELEIIEQRIEEAESLLLKLDRVAQLTAGVRSCRLPYRSQESNISRFLPTNSTTNNRSISTTNNNKTFNKRPGARFLFAKTTKGFVKLICPTCKRSNFLNKLGFVNHCRIMHNVKFSTYEDACLHCGISVDSSIVPLDDPCRSDTPIDHSNLKRKINNNNNNNKKQRTENTKEELNSSIQKSSEIATNDGMNIDKSTNKDNNNNENNNNNNNTTTTTETSNLINNSYISRFYVRKRIIVGNTSKSIRKETLEAGDLSTHKWMIYVRGNELEPDISYFVKKVRFFLDPSFKPNDVIDVVLPPFQITRRGWGEFPVRVQLHFVDTKNKPADIIHQLKLDKTYSGLQKLGGETMVDIELDREFFEKNKHLYPIQNIVSEFSDNNNITDNNEDDEQDEINEENDINNNNNINNEILPIRINPIEYNVTYQEYINRIVEEYPIIINTENNNDTNYKKKIEELPYIPATTIQQWSSWNIGKRKSKEWIRAKCIKQTLNSKYINLIDTIDIITVKDILLYCRSKKFTPDILPNIPCESFTPLLTTISSHLNTNTSINTTSIFPSSSVTTSTTTSSVNTNNNALSHTLPNTINTPTTTNINTIVNEYCTVCGNALNPTNLTLHTLCNNSNSNDNVFNNKSISKLYNQLSDYLDTNNNNNNHKNTSINTNISNNNNKDDYMLQTDFTSISADGFCIL